MPRSSFWCTSYAYSVVSRLFPDRWAIDPPSLESSRYFPSHAPLLSLHCNCADHCFSMFCLTYLPPTGSLWFYIWTETASCTTLFVRNLSDTASNGRAFEPEPECLTHGNHPRAHEKCRSEPELFSLLARWIHIRCIFPYIVFSALVVAIEWPYWLRLWRVFSKKNCLEWCSAFLPYIVFGLPYLIRKTVWSLHRKLNLTCNSPSSRKKLLCGNLKLLIYFWVDVIMASTYFISPTLQGTWNMLRLEGISPFLICICSSSIVVLFSCSRWRLQSEPGIWLVILFFWWRFSASFGTWRVANSSSTPSWVWEHGHPIRPDSLGYVSCADYRCHQSLARKFVSLPAFASTSVFWPWTARQRYSSALLARHKGVRWAAWPINAFVSPVSTSWI